MSQELRAAASSLISLIHTGCDLKSNAFAVADLIDQLGGNGMVAYDEKANHAMYILALMLRNSTTPIYYPEKPCPPA